MSGAGNLALLRANKANATADNLAGQIQGLPVESGFLFAFTDSSGRMSVGVRADGTLVPIKLEVPAAAVGAQALSSDLSARVAMDPVGVMIRSLGEETGYVFSITDAAGRAALLIAQDGTVSFAKAILPDTTVTQVASATKTKIGFQDLGEESGLIFALVDGNGRAALTVDRTGKVWANGISGASSGLDAPSLTSGAAYELWPRLDSNGRQQIYTRRKSDGIRFKLTSVGDNRGATITANNEVIYSRDSTRYWQTAAGGAEWLAEPTYNLLIAFGNSITAADTGPWIPQLASALGISIVDQGVSGQDSDAITARILGAAVTVAGDQIPASGVVAVMPSIPFLTSPASTAVRSMDGTLAGVHGKMTKDVSNAYSFTRASPGSVTACPPGSVFLPDIGVLGQQTTISLEMGRNDAYQYSSKTAPNIARVVSALKNLRQQYLIWGVTPKSSSDEYNGTTARNLIDAHNSAMASLYGEITFTSMNVINGVAGYYIDVAKYLRTYGLQYLGLTPTSDDTADIANGVIPRTLMRSGDPVHPNELGNQVIAHLLVLINQAKGWFS